MREIKSVNQVYRTPLYKRHVKYAVKAGIKKQRFAEWLLASIVLPHQQKVWNNGENLVTALLIMAWNTLNLEEHELFSEFMELAKQDCDSEFKFIR